jgi:D-alanyl-D-alanine carboxypeptidase
VLILQLREQRRIDLDQPIKNYLPGYAGQDAQKVSVHQLLNHTSGLPNFDQVGDAARLKSRSPQDALQVPD